MARATETLITQSLLDRLSTNEDWPTTRAASLRMYREALKRDMEWLLNTRRPPLDGIERFTLASRSVIHYGLIDTSALSLSSSNDTRRLQEAIRNCIVAYEPRLLDVKVVLEQDAAQRRQLRFHIEAQIDLDPAPEEISFDTILDLTSGEYKVN